MAKDVEDVRWRTEVTLSTSSASRALRPAVLLQLKLRDGQMEVWDLDMLSFGQLRCGVAELLAEMELLQNPGRRRSQSAAVKASNNRATTT